LLDYFVAIITSILY